MIPVTTMRCRPAPPAPGFPLVLPVLLLALALAACGRSGDASPPKGGDPAVKGDAAAAPQAMPVTVKRVQPERVPFSLEAVGQAEGSREVEVRPRVTGIIERRLYNEGTPVKAGQVLFQIDRTTYAIAVQQARAALAQEQARREQNQREVERMKSLAQNKAISQREFDDMTSALKQSSAAVEVAQARLAEAELNLSYTEVKAPAVMDSGISGRALRSEGSLVTANNDLLTTLTQVNPIWVRFSLTEPDFTRVRGRAGATRVNLLNPDGTLAAGGGRLNFAGSTVDPKLGTVPLRAEFANPEMKWLPGQYLRVQLLTGEQQAFLVPQSAVVQTEQARQVWIAGADGKAVLRPVQTASWLGRDWIVTGGLQAGDAVIVDNLMKLRPGTAVTIRDAESAGAPAATPDKGEAAPGKAVPSTQPAKADPSTQPAKAG